MTPTKEGFYWAMLVNPTGFADNETADDWKSVYFETVEVFDNNGAPGSGEELMVFCLGRDKAQRLDAFEWGEQIPFPAHYEQRDTMADRELIRRMLRP